MGVWRALVTAGVLLFLLEQLVAAQLTKKVEDDLAMVSSSVSEKRSTEVPKAVQTVGVPRNATRSRTVTTITTTVKPKNSGETQKAKEGDTRAAASTNKEQPTNRQRIAKRNLPDGSKVSTTAATKSTQASAVTTTANSVSGKSSSSAAAQKSPLDLTQAAGHKKKKFVIVKKKKKKPKKKKKVIKVYKKPKKKKYKKVKIHIPKKKKKKKKKKVNVIKVHKKKKHYKKKKHHHF